jgi:hypothetical protein
MDEAVRNPITMGDINYLIRREQERITLEVQTLGKIQRQKYYKKDSEIKNTVWVHTMYAEQQYSFHTTKDENATEKIKG